MTSMRTLLTTVAFAASITAAQAQPAAPAATDADHAAHHPADTTAATPPAATPGGVRTGLGGGAMMGQMMGGVGPMMPMMQGAMMPGGGGMGMMMFGHVEGWIAFYKAELDITAAQLPQWNAFADAMRSSAKGMRTAMAAALRAGSSATLPAREDAMVQVMSARLETMKATLAATTSLYAVLSDDQKKTADELLAERPMGMRAWVAGEP